MRDDFPLQGPTSKITIELEAEVADLLKKMAAHSKLSESEISNTAIKRFITTHSDFLPKKK